MYVCIFQTDILTRKNLQSLVENIQTEDVSKFIRTFSTKYNGPREPIDVIFAWRNEQFGMQLNV